MKITRDIITDLLPVYLSGEASEDTRALVAEFLQQDTQFAELIAEQDKPLEKIKINLSKEVEMKTLQDTRSLLQKRSVYLAFTILFLLFPLSFKFNANGLEWMWADTPVNAVIFAALGIFNGFQYWRISRNLKGSGLE
ncbi:MAG: hypothetical protein KA480_03550 [Anaerolineales bacterium]|nr:hypothetical protein [Anaerolineales bacterium]